MRKITVWLPDSTFSHNEIKCRLGACSSKISFRKKKGFCGRRSTACQRWKANYVPRSYGTALLNVIGEDVRTESNSQLCKTKFKMSDLHITDYLKTCKAQRLLWDFVPPALTLKFAHFGHWTNSLFFTIWNRNKSNELVISQRFPKRHYPLRLCNVDTVFYVT